MHNNGKPYNRVRTTIILCVMSIAIVAAGVFALISYKSRFYTINYHLNVPTSVALESNLNELGFEKAKLVSYYSNDDSADDVIPSSYVEVTCKKDEKYTHPGKALGTLGDSARTIVAWSYRPDGGGKRFYSGVHFKNLFETGGETIDLYAVWTANGTAHRVGVEKEDAEIVTAGGGLYDVKINEETGEKTLPKSYTLNKYKVVYHLSESDDSIWADEKGKILECSGLNEGDVYRFKTGVYRRGYNLVAWEDSEGKRYIPGNRFCNLGKNNETVHLYAVWNRAVYEVTYILEDDENANNVTEFSSPLNEEESTLKLYPAEKDNYYFTGWYANEKLTKRVGEVIGFEGSIKENSVNGTEDEEVTFQTIDLTDTDFIYSNVVLFPGFKHKQYTLNFDIEGENASWSDNPNAKKLRSDVAFFGDVFSVYGDRDIERFDDYILVGWSFEKQEPLPIVNESEKDEKKAEKSEDEETAEETEDSDSTNSVEAESIQNIVPEYDFAAGSKITTTDIEKVLHRGLKHKEELTLYPVWMQNLEPDQKDTFILDCSAQKIGNSVKETDNKIYVSVQASTPTKVTSLDDRFYLVAVNQLSNEVEYVVDSVSQEEAVREGNIGKVSGMPAEQGVARFELLLGSDLTSGEPYHRYTIDLKDEYGSDIKGPSDGTNITAVMLDYALAVKTEDNKEEPLKGYTVVSNTEYVASPEFIAHGHFFNEGRSKKGIQGTENVFDYDNFEYVNADYADVSHVFINLYASNIIAKAPVDCADYENDPIKALEDGYNYEYNGKFYSFQGSPAGLATILNEQNVSLTVQVSLDYSSSTESMINKKARSKGHELYSWENGSRESRETIEAMFCWLGENLSGVSNDRGYASNWILGNEVNSYNAYQYSGSMSRGEFFRSYTQTFRSYYNAIKMYNADAKVYICADQGWNSTENGYAAKDFLDTCANLFMDIEKGTMDWNIAYHPYSYPLTSKSLWENTNISDDIDTTYITMYNLDVLTDYIKQNYYHSGANGEMVTPKVIISELGWTYKDNAKNQAASLVYGYYISACNDLVVAYEPRSMYDAPQETANGLYFGLMNNSGTPRGSLKAYRECDQSIEEPYYQVVDPNHTGWTILKGIEGHIPEGMSFEDVVLRNDNYLAP